MSVQEHTRRLLVDENVHLLRQGIELIGSLSQDIYRHNGHQHFSSGVGKHFRHILDFYDRFLAGDDNLIDYDARIRNPRVETDPSFAVDQTRSIISQLESLTARTFRSRDEDDRVTVRVETRSPDGIGLMTASSVNRELAQLASHTTHHYAIIRLVLSLLDVDVSEQFGVATSTLRHEHRLSGS